MLLRRTNESLSADEWLKVEIICYRDGNSISAEECKLIVCGNLKLSSNMETLQSQAIRLIIVTSA